MITLNEILLIAARVKAQRAAREQWAAVSMRAAEQFALVDPDFDRARFLVACGNVRS